MTVHRLALACAAAWLCCAGTVARASGLQVSPTSLTLAPGRNADGLWLGNTGEQTLHAQVRVLHWTQHDGTEQLTPSQGLVASPPMIELAVGARQLVRVIRTAPAQGPNEEAYRVLVDELPLAPPSAQPPAQDADGQHGLRFVLRYSVPVFLPPPNDAQAAPQLHARLLEDGGRRMLEVANRGRAHAQLGNLVRVDAQGRRTELVAGLVGYVLAGSTMRWPLAPDAPPLAAGDRLSSRINGAPDEQTLAVVGASP
jgi:fimbrial chaperone protein